MILWRGSENRRARCRIGAKHKWRLSTETRWGGHTESRECKKVPHGRNGAVCQTWAWSCPLTFWRNHMINKDIVFCHALPSSASASLIFWEYMVHTIPPVSFPIQISGQVLILCSHRACTVLLCEKSHSNFTGLWGDEKFSYIMEGHGEQNREENNACDFSGRDAEAGMSGHWSQWLIADSRRPSWYVLTNSWDPQFCPQPRSVFSRNDFPSRAHNRAPHWVLNIQRSHWFAWSAPILNPSALEIR
jgi:hypothetical protein